MDQSYIYLIFLLVISVISGGIYVLFRYLEYRQNEVYLTMEFALQMLLIYIPTFSLSYWYFSELTVWGMNWWVAYLVITGIVSGIPVLVHMLFFPHVFPTQVIFTHVQYGNPEKALQLFEKKKMALEGAEKDEILFYIGVFYIQQEYELKELLLQMGEKEKTIEEKTGLEEKIKKAFELFDEMEEKENISELFSDISDNYEDPAERQFITQTVERYLNGRTK